MSAKRVLFVVLVVSAVMLAVGIGPRVTGSAQASPPAQEPDPKGVTIPYPGRLSDQAGQPVPDGAYDFTFTIYDIPTGGEPLWSETQEGVEVKEGAFVTPLGSVNPIPAEVLEGSGCFSLKGPSLLEEWGPRTRYERKWRREGRRIFHLEAEKVAGRKLVRIAEGEMPHVKLTGEVKREAVEGLVGLKESWPGGAFVVKAVYWSPEGEEALVRAFSTDQGFQQHYFLVVTRGRDGWVVKLDGATVPFRTPAVKRSVARLAAVLERGER